MKTLSILRHAKSSWSDPTIDDRDRPLNKRGKRDAPLMGRRMIESAIRPSLILSSPATRAWATACTVAREISYPREFLQRDSRLYLASVEQIVSVLAEQDQGFNSILLIGHNPGLTEFANRLAPGLTSNVPTCGLVAVELDTDSWDLTELPRCKLLTYDYPKRHRDPGDSSANATDI